MHTLLSRVITDYRLDTSSYCLILDTTFSNSRQEPGASRTFQTPKLFRLQTSKQTIERMSEECICPICLDDLPDMTWRGNERSRLLCCGKQMCKACTNLMLLSNRQKCVAAAAAEAQQSQEYLTITDLADLEEGIKRAIIGLKCP